MRHVGFQITATTYWCVSLSPAKWKFMADANDVLISCSSSRFIFPCLIIHNNERTRIATGTCVRYNVIHPHTGSETLDPHTNFIEEGILLHLLVFEGVKR